VIDDDPRAWWETARIHASAYVAPNATVCGEVTVGAESRVLFGAVLTAESGPVTIGERASSWRTR